MDFQQLRENMISSQIMNRGITDRAVIEAMRKIPRHKFIPETKIEHAYEDGPIPIGEGQTISQPYMVALMTQCLQLKKRDSVLEIGTGSGYQTAVLAQMCESVYTFEQLEGLSEKAKSVLNEQKFTNIKFFVGDGSQGVHDQNVHFDAIMVTAAAPNPMKHLLNQLKNHGRMVIPVGSRANQTLILFTKENDHIDEEKICQCVFVPLTGKYGWQENLQ